MKRFPLLVSYIRRKKDGPFTVAKRSSSKDVLFDWIIDCQDSPVYLAPLNGNSKQRRQQRRALVRDLNQ